MKGEACRVDLSVWFGIDAPPWVLGRLRGKGHGILQGLIWFVAEALAGPGHGRAGQGMDETWTLQLAGTCFVRTVRNQHLKQKLDPGKRKNKVTCRHQPLFLSFLSFLFCGCWNNLIPELGVLDINYNHSFTPPEL